MAQFLKAKFLSQALEWKFRFPAAQFFAGLRYVPYIFKQARRTFSNYSKLYPDDKNFVTRFVRDLRNRNADLLKIINPEVITPEAETENSQFEAESLAEQREIARATGQPVGQPFSFSAPPPTPTAPRIPTITIPAAVTGAAGTPVAEKNVTETTAAPTPAGIPNLPQTPSTNMPTAISTPVRTSPVTKQAESIAVSPSTSKFNFSAFRSRVGKGIAGAAKSGLETANPYLGRLGNRLVGGLTSIVSPGRLGGAGSKSILGRFAGGGRGRGIFGGGGSVVSKAKGRGGLIFAIGLIGFMILVGALAAFSPSGQTTSAGPLPTPAPSYQPGIGSGVIGCPLNNPTSITNGSKDAGGHCSRSYVQDYGVCAQPEDINYTGKETAIDVTSADHMVYLPELNNNSVTWTIIKVDPNTDYIDNGVTVNGGYSIRASAQSAGKTYLIRFVHIDSTSLIEGQQALSGAPVGFYRDREAHVHITIMEDGIFKPVDLYFNLCR